MRLRWLVAAIAVVAVLSLLAHAPARLLQTLGGDQLKFSGLSGSFWRGQAADLRVVTANGDWRLGQTHWRVSRFSVLFLSPRVHINSSWRGQTVEGIFSVSLGGTLNAENALVSMPAALAKLWFPVTVGGQLYADITELEIQGQTIDSLVGTLEWRDADWTALNAPIELGHYRAILAEQDGGVTAEVATVRGPVQVTGQALWNAGNYKVDLKMSSDGAMNPSLRTALSLVAPETGGEFHFVYPGG